MDAQRFYAHGKLMLTGEYAVLDGAKALAIPTRYGQSLEVSNLEDSSYQIDWLSYTHDSDIWLSAKLPSIDIEKPEVLRLQQILKAVDELNPSIFYQKNLSFKTIMEFPRDWGLGSSSTLLSLLSEWASINPYDLLEKTFGGSGYDIACASANGPIIYQSKNHQIQIETCQLSKGWTDHAYFVFLNQKKNSREAIEHYRSLSNTEEIVSTINRLSDSLRDASGVQESMDVLIEHEALMANTLNLKSVNKDVFNDFKGACKSLGAWGGDFIMAVTKEDANYVKEYFAKNGLNTIFAFEEMIWI